LPSAELNQKVNEASFVISRCGYSTVMDLAVLKKKSILVPTPGQTEQEELARHLMKNNFAFFVWQNKFRLKNALNLAQEFNYQIQKISAQNQLDDVLNGFIVEVYASLNKSSPV
jgi:UDP-N-acetylglucosamine:LPS N-acetylglucosamine transferase